MLLSISGATATLGAVDPTVPSWASLELRHLYALVAVAEAGTISRAAERLGYTQSAVSQQIAGLERAVGASVFDRPGGPKPLRLTEAGDALVLHARAVLSLLRDAEADVRAVATGSKGRLRVGTVQSAGNRILPGVLRRFHGERPGVEVLLRESGDPAELLALVEQGELDVTFCEYPIEGPFESLCVLEDPIYLIAPADSPEAAMASVSVEHVATLPLVGHRGDQCMAVSLRCFEGMDVDPNFVFRSDDNNTLQGCVGAGLGYAVVPLLTIDTTDPTIAVVPLDRMPAPRELALAWHATRRKAPALDAFVAIVADVCAGISVAIDA